MAGKGGNRPGAGRPVGSKDKISRNLKQVVLDTMIALDKKKITLASEAEKDPRWFYANFVKPMLPKDVVISGDEDNPLKTKVEITLVRPKED